MDLKISSFKRIVVLTGAGISAESGISTFRDSNGLWEKHRIEDVATPEAFERNPKLVWRFYSLRRRDANRVQPNAAHLALAQFAQTAPKRGIRFTLVTQNVDMLHERASQKYQNAGLPIPMHGQLFYSRCVHCEEIFEDHNSWYDEKDLPTSELLPVGGKTPKRTEDHLPLSPCCKKLLRPHIVWFGEMPLYMDKILEELSASDLFVTIGSSGQVYPAAGFIEQAKIAGAATACLNKEPLPQQAMVDFYIEGSATQTIPRFFATGEI